MARTMKDTFLYQDLLQITECFRFQTSYYRDNVLSAGCGGVRTVFFVVLGGKNSNRVNRELSSERVSYYSTIHS